MSEQPTSREIRNEVERKNRLKEQLYSEPAPPKGTRGAAERASRAEKIWEINNELDQLYDKMYEDDLEEYDDSEEVEEQTKDSGGLLKVEQPRQPAAVVLELLKKADLARRKAEIIKIEARLENIWESERADQEAYQTKEVAEEEVKEEIKKDEKKEEKKSTGVLKTGLAGAVLGIGHALGAPIRGIAHFFHGVQEWLDHYVESQKKKMTLTSIVKDIGHWFASIFKMGGGGGGGGHH